jgi:hypothetical protein
MAHDLPAGPRPTGARRLDADGFLGGDHHAVQSLAPEVGGGMRPLGNADQHAQDQGRQRQPPKEAERQHDQRQHDARKAMRTRRAAVMTIL